MKKEDKHFFLDNPGTLETVSVLLTCWYDRNNNKTDSSILIRYGCCLTPAFDTVIQKRFTNWDIGLEAYNKAYEEWGKKGFKSRRELGIKDADENLCHDEIVKSIRKQLVDLYFTFYDDQAYIPEWRTEQRQKEQGTP